MQTDAIGRKNNIAEIRKNKLKRALFIVAMIIVPMTNFLVFYIYVNASSIFMAFEKTTLEGETSLTLDWFRLVLDYLFVTGNMMTDLKNTMYYFLTSLLIILPITTFIAYFIYKKILMYKFFRIMFFLPSIFSAVVLTTIYKQILGVEGPVAGFFAQIQNLDAPPDFFSAKSVTATIIIYCIWTGFGTNLILMTGAMARIPEDVLEAGQLDGVSWARELFSIIVPLIWPTVTTLIVLTFVGIFTASGPILLFARDEPSASTISYFIFKSVKFSGDTNFPAAVGLFFTVISVPIILGVKKLMERWQDAIEY